MPLYEYQCENCGDLFEVMQKFSDEPLTKHDKCGGRVHRLLSAPALQFKGSGWYITDYAKGGATAPSSGAKKDDSSSASSPASDKNSKPASDAKPST
jgi:putative FmdB family regulatory protein